jgi:hypothetical protein
MVEGRQTEILSSIFIYMMITGTLSDTKRYFEMAVLCETQRMAAIGQLFIVWKLKNI